MNMIYSLLAKSRRKEDGRIVEPVSLLDHSKAVLVAARAILDEIEAFLPPDMAGTKLRKLVLAGAVLHDIGKANNLFQGMLRPVRAEFPWLGNQRQPLRHEGLSALIVAGYVDATREFSDHLASELFGDWENPDKMRWMLAWLVGGHHLKMHHAEEDEAGMVRIGGIPSGDIRFRGDLLGETWQREFADVLCAAPCIPDFAISTDISSNEHHVALMDDFAWESEERTESLSPEEMRLLAFAKAILIAADAAGSALWDGEGNGLVRLKNGVNASLRNHCRSDDLTKIVRARLRAEGAAEHETRLYPFQRQVRDSREDRVVLEAACGGGKTVAAYEWARRHVDAGRKLIVCYPTTGTAAAGFEDYLLTQGDLERKLMTSRADTDVRLMLANEPETADDEVRDLRHPNRTEDLETLMKQETLQAWGQQAIAATADFVLGLMQNHRRSLFGFPAILGSAIVFDEIHSYDAKMFGSLTRFLRAFPNVPALLMTASLQPSRRKAMKAAGIKYETVSGDDDAETTNRYRLKWRERDSSTTADGIEITAPDEYWEEVQAALNGGGKVLWVCNTVADAVRAYDEAERLEGDAKRLLFHSRFCHRHRVDRQNEILAAFDEGGAPCFAVTTQVCEMSLDISASLLVTALPPFPALVQRMGRLNRRLENLDGAACLVYDYDGMDGRPYRRVDLTAARDTVGNLAEREVLSQRDLRNALERMPEADDSIKFHSAWLDGGWESRQATLREGDATVPVLLAQHKDHIRRRIEEIGENAAVKEWLVPILAGTRDAEGVHIIGRIRGYPLVSGIKYDEEKGAR